VLLNINIYLFESVSATGQSTTPSTAAVASETALGINVSTVPQPPPLAYGETRSLAAGSSVTTLPDMNVNSGTRNPSEMTSTDTIGKNEPKLNILFKKICIFISLK